MNIFQSLIEKEVSAIPIISKDKRPGRYIDNRWYYLEWQKYQREIADKKTCEGWSKWPGVGVGVVLGKVSGIVAIDFDNQPELCERIYKMLPGSPVIKKGSKGFTAFYKYNGEGSRRWVVDGEVICELLSDGRQTVIPPSQHPNGNNYEWLTSETLLTIDKNELPSLPNLDFINEIVGGKTNSKQVILEPKSKENSLTTIDEVIDALEFCSPDCGYHEWIEIGMAIASEFPGGDGLNAWNNWSAKGSKYKESEMQNKWASFRGSGINIETLFWYANLNGYYARQEINPDIQASVENLIANLENKKTEIENTKKESFVISDDLAMNAPGLVGKITRWITQTAIKPQPALSLGVALSLVGALKAHRVRTETNLRTNLLIIGLAKSGAGKNHPIESAKKILHEVLQSGLVGGEPQSAAGLLKSMQNNFGRRLILWDEFGEALKILTSRNAAGHQAAIIGTTMKLFSSAGSIFIGGEYADHDSKMSRKDIEQPCLCVFGASTPGNFYKSLNSSHALSGFLPRWLVFEIENKRVKKRREALTAANKISENIIEEIKSILNMPTNTNPSGNLDAISGIKPKVVNFSKEAETLFWEADDWFEDQAQDAAEGVDTVWNRASEHAAKLALTVCDNSEITKEDLTWAVEITTTCISALAQSITTQIADSDFERKKNKVKEIISKNENGVLRKTLLKNSHTSAKELNEILNTMLEAEEITAQPTSGAGRRGNLYKIYS